jgi:hypothetical protein
MTNQQHPITPPPELVQQWYDQAKQDPCGPINWVAVRAAQWGADQELDACCEWFTTKFGLEVAADIADLRAARRPKPPSLKEQALLAIDTAVADDRLSADVANVVRQALEQLDD